MSIAPAERQRLLSPIVIASFGAMMLFALVLAFPRGRIEHRLLGGASADTLAIAYLQAWLQVEPNNADVLTALTTEYLHGSQVGDAERLLRRMLNSPDPALRQGGLLIEIGIAEQAAYAMKPSDPERRSRLIQLDQLLTQAVGYTWQRKQLELLADKARGLNDGLLAGRFYQALATADPGRAGYWFERDAAAQLASGRYREAAQADFAAMDNAAQLNERRRYYMAGLSALQSGGLLSEAMAQAQQRIGPLADDDQTLRFLAGLALASGRPDLAQSYVRHLLKMSWQVNRQPPVWHYASWRDMPAMHFALAGWSAGQRPMMLRVGDSHTQAMPPAEAGALQGKPAKPMATLPAPIELTPAGTVGESPAAPNLASAVAEAREGATPTKTQAGATASESLRARPATAAAASTPSLAPAKAPNKPFNATDYELGYTVFLANGDVRDALALAQSAVAQAPDLLIWHERLAQVAEWSDQSQLALDNYLILAQKSGADKYWQQVLRLAPGLGANSATLLAYRYQAEHHPADMAMLDQLIAAYEGNADVDGGLDYLSGHAQGANRQAVLERYAALAERAGKDGLAFQTYQTLEHDFGPSASYGLKLALFDYQHAQFKDALAALSQAKAAALPENDMFWRFYALLGRLTQQSQATVEGYKKLLVAGRAGADDLSNMIDYFQDSPLDAGRLAEYAYTKTHEPRSLIQAVYSYTRARAPLRVAVLLAALTPEQLRAAIAAPGFLLARAEYAVLIGNPDWAMRDARAALQLTPNSRDANVAYLYLLNERGSNTDLRAALANQAHAAEDDPAYWGAYTAAYMRLGDARAALHYLHKQAASRHQDPLWELAFSDALEMSGAVDAAWQVRRHVWTQLLSAKMDHGLPSDVPPDQLSDLRSRFVSLADLFKGSDASKRVLIELLRADDAAQAAPTPQNAQSEFGDIGRLPPPLAKTLVKQQQIYSAAARDAGLAWAQSQTAYPLERAWLEQQYIKRLSQPAYALITIALAEHNLAEMNRLLDEMPDRIPLENKIDAEAGTGRLGDAQTDVYEAQQTLPDNNNLNAALREHTLPSAQAIAPGFRAVAAGVLNYTETTLAGGVRLNANTSIVLDYLDRLQHADPLILPGVPGYDRSVNAALNHFGVADSETLKLGQRVGMASFFTARFDGTLNNNESVSYAYSLARNQEATENQPLMIGGVKDLASVGVNYKPDPHIFSGLTVEYDRFYGQDRSFLGTGITLNGQAGYKFRIEYPDYTVRLVVTHAQYNATGNPGALLDQLVPLSATPSAAPSAIQFMPHGFTQAALLFGFGTDLPTGYSQAWRPFFEAGPLQDSRAGTGEQINFGLVGSLIGTDQWLVYFSHSSASQTGSNPVTEVGMRYRWMY